MCYLRNHFENLFRQSLVDHRIINMPKIHSRFSVIASIVSLSSSFFSSPIAAQTASSIALPPVAKGAIRIATFNAALNRKSDGQLVKDLRNGDEQAKRIATIVQLVAPDILLLNEVDYSNGDAAKILFEDYLNNPQAPKLAPEKDLFKYFYTSSVNTGVPSGQDLNLNGRSNDADDGWGYGAFPGQYGMAVFSKLPIQTDAIRTFQMLKWSAMPEAKRPFVVDKATGAKSFFHSDALWQELRLSSKSHWDVPIQIGNSILHVIASHPTPPVFDGLEDRNGCRNHDEIRLIKDYVEGESGADYIVDDNGKAGPLDQSSSFVVLGDLNSDPVDGSGISQGIIDLLASKRVASKAIPSSQGAIEANAKQGQANLKQKGKPEHDTADFNDKSTGNLRVDFALPSSDCTVVDSGVFWPTVSELSDVDRELIEASDHRLVWIDIRLP